jgi:hypothetical protein
MGLCFTLRCPTFQTLYLDCMLFLEEITGSRILNIGESCVLTQNL